MSKLLVKYLTNLGDKLQSENVAKIIITNTTDDIKIGICYYHTNKLYMAVLKNKVNIIESNAPDFANVYLYAIITIQLILNSREKAREFLSNFIQYSNSFISSFDLYYNSYTHGEIMNRLFNVKYGSGDCELNSAFAVYLLNQQKFDYDFNNIIDSMRFKIEVYKLFMEYIIGCRTYNSNHFITNFHFDFKEDTLPKTNKLPDVEFDYNDTICPIHALLIEYNRKQMKYIIHDLNEINNDKEIKLIAEYINDYYFEACVDNQRFIYRYNGEGQFINYNEGKYIDVGLLNFNQFKYLILNYLLTTYLRYQRTGAMNYTSWQLLISKLNNIKKTDFNLLNEYLNYV